MLFSGAWGKMSHEKTCSKNFRYTVAVKKTIFVLIWNIKIVIETRLNWFFFRNLEGLEKFGLDKCDQLTAVLEALLYTESGGGAPLKDIDQVNYLVWKSEISWQPCWKLCCTWSPVVGRPWRTLIRWTIWFGVISWQLCWRLCFCTVGAANRCRFGDGF
jgi:hypothetical protein